MGKPGIMLYFELRPCIQQMNQQEKAEMLDAMLDYGEFGRTPELSEKLQMLWPLIQLKLDRDSDRYERTVIRNQYAQYAKDAGRKNVPKLSYEQWKEQQAASGSPLGTSGDPWESSGDPWESSGNLWESSGVQTTNHKLQTTSSKPQTPNKEPAAARPPFCPPTREDITVYCRELGYSMDTDSFLDYYSANGWMIGKSPMKDWRAAVRRWNRKENGNGAADKLPGWTVGEVL